ncbi:MAG: hypothetical protein ACREPH_12430 [Rhodanobacteraceae bacterium]
MQACRWCRSVAPIPFASHRFGPWLGTWVLLLSIGAIVEVVTRRIFVNRDLLQALQRLFH